jgi:hypothetical protein
MSRRILAATGPNQWAHSVQHDRIFCHGGNGGHGCWLPRSASDGPEVDGDPGWGASASSLIECINGLLKQFLRNRRWCPSPESLQRYLNLFTLWHNMRVYERGKRQGQSPYQRAGIDPGSDDWLALLGYTVA